MNNPLKLKCGPEYARTYLAVLLPGLLFFQGCASATAVPPEENTEAVTTPLVINDKIPAVSELYQVPAPTLSREQQRQRLEAIDALVRSGDYAKARQETDKINPSTLSGQEASQLNLLNAQINLSIGEAEVAIEHLKQIQPYFFSLEQKIDYLQAQAFAFSLTGQVLDSATARIDLSHLLPTPEAQAQNQLAILETLSLLPDEDLKTGNQPATSNLAGWLALARLYKQKDAPDFNARLRQWRETFRDHPADMALLSKSPRPVGNAIHYPGSIAVILPGSGPFADAGKAIKAGIMAAFDHLDSNSYKPNLHFYDSEQTSPADNYHQAIAAGAELIIGPLDKKDIQRLADSVTLDVPVLALNHIQQLEQDNLYQFALSPLDDVAQLADKAREDGHKKALLLLPETPQTRRIAGYFEEDWQSGDSAIVKTQTYRPKDADFLSSIDKLLNRNENQANDPEAPVPVNETLGADAIFISAYGPEARAIKQRLNALGAGNLAVYALPNIYAGTNNPAQDQVLDAVVFCDMPWLFDKADQGNPRMKSLAGVRQQFPESYLRLVAMGIDAFNLSARLIDLNSHPYPGATGKLSLAEDNRIKRELICAKFAGGKPEINGFMAPDGKAIAEPGGEIIAPVHQSQ